MLDHANLFMRPATPQTDPSSQGFAPVLVLTGGIGAGKSTAAKAFESQAIRVIDADDISHEVTGPNGLAVPALLDAFGPNLVTTEKGLNRTAMREYAFQNVTVRQQLESIVHPFVSSRALQLLKSSPSPYTVYIVPLWIEGRGTDPKQWPSWFWRLLVIDLPEAIQRQRVLQRSPMPEATLSAVLARQATRAERLRLADFSILNDQNPEHLWNSVTRLHLRLISELNPQSPSDQP